MKDIYTRVLVVNALATIDSEDKTTLDTLRTMHDMRVEKDDMVCWQAQSETPTHGTGAAADIEVTALAVQGLLRCGRELGTVSKAITYLVKNKDAYGTWQSTQATIQALRAMLMAEGGATAVTNANIDVILNNQEIAGLTVDETNSDVLQLIDLKDHTRTGENAVRLAFEGTGSLLYQIIVYLREVSQNEPVGISYQLLAKYPLKAKTPKSVAYEYYNPEVRTESEPIQLVVAKLGGIE